MLLYTLRPCTINCKPPLSTNREQVLGVSSVNDRKKLFFIWTAHGKSLTPGLLNSGKKNHCAVFKGKTLQNSHVIMPWKNCQKMLMKWQGRVGWVGNLQWANILNLLGQPVSWSLLNWAGNWVMSSSEGGKF